MTATFTIIDGAVESNGADGRKRIFGTLSFTNPYTAGGDSFSLSTYFPNKFLGGRVTAVNASVAVGLAGAIAHSTFRADTSSTATAIIQFFAGGLTTLSGTFIDNTTANISAATCTVELFGY